MSDIDLNGVYRQKKNQFGRQGADDPIFDDDFLDAVNRAIGQINVQADLETRISRVTTWETTIGLSDAYEYVFSSCVTRHLLMAGYKLRKDEVNAYAADLARLDDEIDLIRQDILNQAVTADTDDTDDLVGLGGLG